MEVIQLDKFLKQNKLLFKPEFFISTLTRFNKMKESMIQKVALIQLMKIEITVSQLTAQFPVNPMLRFMRKNHVPSTLS